MARKKDKEKEKEESMGFGKEEKAEAAEAEKMKSGQMDERSVKTKEGATYDKMTGEVEGGVKFKDGNEKGLNAIVKIAEEVKVEQDHYAKVKTLTFGGKVAVENPSTVDRLWDIDVTLKGIEKTNLESGEIHIKELGTEEEDKVSAQEFELKGEATNLLVVKEYINTLPDADNILSIEAIKKNLDTLASKTKEKKNTEETGEKKETSEDDSGLEAFGISIAKDVNVTFAIAIKSLFDQPVKSIKVIKNIPDEFINVGIKGATAGTAEPKKQQIEWNIDELDPQNVVMLNFTATIKVETIEAKKTGTLEVTYVGQSSFAEGLAIDKFDAYTRNRFYVDILERDEQPGFWDCKLVFENSSEFNVDLFNADVYAPGDESKKFVDVDPNDVPRLPAGAQWYSNTWEYQSEEYPQFRKMLEFRVVPDFQTMVNGTIAIADVELAIASHVLQGASMKVMVRSFESRMKCSCQPTGH